VNQAPVVANASRSETPDHVVHQTEVDAADQEFVAQA